VASHKNSVKIAKAVTKKFDAAQPEHMISDCPLATEQIRRVSESKLDSAHPIFLLRKA
jgi:glycerol-3-phosphate dehydrogenase subunit C